LAPTKDKPAISVVHASARLGSLRVDAYNAELRDGEGFIGDRASNRAFRAVIDEWRERLRDVGHDPFGDTPTTELSKKKLDRLLMEGDPESAGVIQGAMEAFSSELSTVITRFLKLKEWRPIQRIVVGGGLRASRVGELVIGRSSVLLKAAGHDIDLVPIQHHPDHAALVGAAYLAPDGLLTGHGGYLAVDIGGSNIRAGVVELHPRKEPDPGKSVVGEMELWRHADETPSPKRQQAVERIGAMLERLIGWADKNELALAPFVGIACPGLIAEDGHIDRGGQNLPGNWESNRFNLPQAIREMIPKIHGGTSIVVMHNDAVVQGLSQTSLCQDVEHWGVLTIGTGLGNAKFSNAVEVPARTGKRTGSRTGRRAVTKRS
jgi:predicted NBD/HSP70 family sugar kinase